MRAIFDIKQGSPEWWALKVGKISGTRFSQVISGRANRLVYDLVNEILDGCIWPGDYIDEDMQFGIDNEPVAADKYSEASGIKWDVIGAILSDHSDISMASPDRIDETRTKILEIKCTQNGAIHLQRFKCGVESSLLGQIKNYFCQSDAIQEVHWVSFCPFRPERPLVPIIFTRDMFENDIPKWREQIKKIEEEVKEIKNQFIF